MSINHKQLKANFLHIEPNREQQRKQPKKEKQSD